MRRIIRKNFIRDTASTLIHDCGIKQPPVDIELVADKCGASIRKEKLKGSNVSGFLYAVGDKKIIGVNISHHVNRQRFTIGHELGHLLLHKNRIGSPHIDKLLPVRFRNDSSSEGKDREEIEANLFSAELLMPAAFVEKTLSSLQPFDLNDESVVSEMAKQYKVSPQAMLVRLTSLGYITI